MQNIVILGGGFAGVAAAKDLLKQGIKDAKITVVNKYPYHLFTPALYEVATTSQAQQNITIDFKEIFGKKVDVIIDEVTKVDAKTSKVTLKKRGSLSYDYLIIALGSESAYMNIPGLEKNAISLKTLDDAIKIKDTIKSVCCEEDVCKRKAHIVIGGGGFTGTELAAEMLMYKVRLAKQEHLDKDCLDVTIIQGSDRLLKELDPHVSKIATKRIAGASVKFCFGGHIKEVTDKYVETDDGNRYIYDLLIWTGGVRPNSLAAKSGLPVNKRGQIIVNEKLQVDGYKNIFAIGDIAGYINPKTQKPVPWVAQVAEDHGKTAAENVAALINGKHLHDYKFVHYGYVVPLKGKFAAAELVGLHIDGFIAWIIQQLVVFRYLLGVLPPWKAIANFNTFEKHLFTA